MDFRITENDRAQFKRCRRQWDFASPHRRGLEPVGVVDAALPAALNKALAVYYFPGTWDWEHDLKQSLVHKAVRRALDRADTTDALRTATTLLDSYDGWATTVDDFAPVKVDQDVRGLVTDPRDPECGLMTRDGSPVVYTCRIDLLAADAADEYWIVRHQLVDEWQELDALIRDEAMIAACWTWEQEYLGMAISGTIHNEIRNTSPLELPPADRAAKAAAIRVRQSEPSGGGRIIPQHRRISARPSASDPTSRVSQCTAGLIRRTRIRRNRAEIGAAGKLIAAEAIDMSSEPAVYPTFAAHCRICAFSGPCLACVEGTDPEPQLAANFHRRATDERAKPGPGQSTWGFGRGAAPPKW